MVALMKKKKSYEKVKKHEKILIKLATEQFKFLEYLSIGQNFDSIMNDPREVCVFSFFGTNENRL